MVDDSGAELPATAVHWPQTDTASQLTFGEASDQNVVLRQDRGGGASLTALFSVSQINRDTPPHYTRYPSMCTLVASGSPGTHAGVFHDIVLWAEGAGRALQLMDVNKDNDELMDATDWFPLDFLYVFDNDNDGIGNAADIVPAHGSCVQSDKRGACYSDLMVLYLVWAGFVIVLTTSVFFMARWYYRRKLIIRAAAKAPLASSNGVASGGSGRMGQVRGGAGCGWWYG